MVGQVDRRTFQSALEALPRRPARIVIIDDSAAPSGAHRARDLDGFVPLGSSVIYLRRQSPTLRSAEDQGGAYLLALATVIWHEMAHAEGVDETGARQQEEDLPGELRPRRPGRKRRRTELSGSAETATLRSRVGTH